MRRGFRMWWGLFAVALERGSTSAKTSEQDPSGLSMGRCLTCWLTLRSGRPGGHGPFGVRGSGIPDLAVVHSQYEDRGWAGPGRRLRRQISAPAMQRVRNVARNRSTARTDTAHRPRRWMDHVGGQMDRDIGRHAIIAAPTTAPGDTGDRPPARGHRHAPCMVSMERLCYPAGSPDRGRMPPCRSNETSSEQGVNHQSRPASQPDDPDPTGPGGR